jgi:hypothetical protein
VSGTGASAILSFAIGLERWINATLVDEVASYASTRFVVAALCTAAGATLLVVDAIKQRRVRRQRPTLRA